MSSITNKIENILAAAFSSGQAAKYGTTDDFFLKYKAYFTAQDAKAFKHWRQGHTKRDLPAHIAQAVITVLEYEEPERYEAARQMAARR